MVLVNWVCEERRNSASFAQASLSRLSESCRISFLVLVRISRLGDQCQCWAIGSLAQARMARPSKVTMRLVHVKRETSFRRGVMCVWANDGLA